jgi:alkylation response protein AidB-like acyl-CoA dehydrogenase
MDLRAFELSPVQAEIQDHARAFGERWAPHATNMDRNDEAPIQDMVRDTVEHDLAGLTIPIEYGGQGHNAIEFAIAIEASCRAMKSWMAGDILFATTCTAPSVIMISDNAAMHELLLPRFAAGTATGAIALSEPNHGSAVTDIETTAIPDGDVLVINGRKRFITGAPEYDTYVTFVRLNDTPGMKGIGAVVVEKEADGFTLENGPDYMRVARILPRRPGVRELPGAEGEPPDG